MLLRARESFHAGRRFVPKGQIVEASDPVVTAARADLFEPVTAEVIEQATRAPGEVRRVSIPKPEAKPSGGMTTKNRPDKGRSA